MTAPGTDPVWQFVQALPARIRRQLNRTEKLVVLVHRAVNEHGWDPKQLARESSDHLGGAVNDCSVVMKRLEARADRDPDVDEGPRKLPFCSPECRDNAGWILDAAGMPAKRCSCRNVAVSS